MKIGRRSLLPKPAATVVLMAVAAFITLHFCPIRTKNLQVSTLLGGSTRLDKVGIKRGYTKHRVDHGVIDAAGTTQSSTCHDIRIGGIGVSITVHTFNCL